MPARFPDGGRVVQQRRVLLQVVKRTAYLFGLVVEPGLVLLFLRAHARLVDLQDAGIHHAVGQGLLAQGAEALVLAGGDDLAAAGDGVEIFQDHARIIQRHRVFRDEDRDLAERVLGAQGIAFVQRVGGFDDDLVGQPQDVGGDLDLAAERGGERGTKVHGHVAGSCRLKIRCAGVPVRAGWVGGDANACGAPMVARLRTRGRRWRPLPGRRDR